MLKPSIGVFAIAVLAASINVAAAQRVEPAPMAGGGPGALPSPGEGPFATIPAHPDTLPMAGGGAGALPSPYATTPSSEPSHSSHRRHHSGKSS
jgi:hypothetical protein